jgi:hypothetical protein
MTKTEEIEFWKSMYNDLLKEIREMTAGTPVGRYFGANPHE